MGAVLLSLDKRCELFGRRIRDKALATSSGSRDVIRLIRDHVPVRNTNDRDRDSGPGKWLQYPSIVVKPHATDVYARDTVLIERAT